MSGVRILSRTDDLKERDRILSYLFLLLTGRSESERGSVSPAGSVGAPAAQGRPLDDRALSRMSNFCPRNRVFMRFLGFFIAEKSCSTVFNYA